MDWKDEVRVTGRIGEKAENEELIWRAADGIEENGGKLDESAEEMGHAAAQKVVRTLKAE